MSQQHTPRTRSVAPLVVLAMAVAMALIAGAIWWRPAARMVGLDPSRVGLGQSSGSPSASPGGGSSSAGTAPSGSPSAAVAGTAGLAGSAAPVAPTAPLSPARLAKALAAVKVSGIGTTSGIVLDAQTGQAYWTNGQTRQMIPASTMKLLTCTAALDSLGPDTHFTTKVVQPAKGTIVLVGGGDPFLASKPTTDYPHPATSVALAQQTARKLKAAGVKSVHLGYDDSMFAGPFWHPSWPASYHDQVSTVSALWIDKGHPSAKQPASTTPSSTAAGMFATELKAQGITVAGSAVARKAASGDELLASVDSLPVRTIVAETLAHSDNSAAEVLLRHVGIATGNGGTFSGGVKGVQQRLTALKVWVPGSVMTDGSGLSRNNHVSAAMLAGVLHLAATDPKLSALLEGLPTAGVSGTLSARFYTPQGKAGRGWVNAKTGTLTKVSTLAGTTVTHSGHAVVFAFMANNPTQEWNVRTWLDDMAAAVTAS